MKKAHSPSNGVRNSSKVFALPINLVQAIPKAVRRAEYHAIHEAYLKQPDSAPDADDWSTSRPTNHEVVRDLAGELAPAGSAASGVAVSTATTPLTVARQWFDSWAGASPPSRHREVKRALGHALGWKELFD
jgi:hypothetical protein